MPRNSRSASRFHDITWKDLESGGWLRLYAPKILRSTDAALFPCAGLTVGLLAFFFKREVESGGAGALFALTAVGFAALAVALTALSIFVSLVNDAYLRVLDSTKEGGLPGYIIPFLAAGLISSIATIFGAVSAVVYPAVPDWTKACILGLEVGLVVWAAWAVFQIIVDVAAHGVGRYQIARAVQNAKRPDLNELFSEPPPPSESGDFLDF